MPIQSSDLRVFRATTNNDTAANGGEISTSESVTGVSGNLFPRVSVSERVSGVTRVRKAFHRVNNADSLTLFDSNLFMFQPTPAVDAVTFFESTMTETQGAAEPLSAKTHYGSAVLQTTVTAGAESIVVTPEQSEYVVFRTGERIYITDKTTYGAAGNEEYAVVTGVTPSGDDYTLALSAPLNFGYTQAVARIGSVLDYGDLKCTLAEFSATSASGSLNQGQITVRQRGAMYDVATITFTSATNFSCSTVKRGVIGTGIISATFSPVNPDTSSPYFSIPSTAWSGTFAISDTFAFRTLPAALPVMYVQTVPANAPAFSGNSFTMVLFGETE